DGSVFIACAFAHVGASSVPGEWRINRLSAVGIQAPGWPLAGRSFGTLDLTGVVGADPTHLNAPLIDICADGNGGVFAYVGAPSVDPTFGTVSIDPRVLRLTSSGSGAPNWPVGGAPVPGFATSYNTPFADNGL